MQFSILKPLSFQEREQKAINAGTLRTNETSENHCSRETLLYKDLDLKDHKEMPFNYNYICKDSSYIATVLV